MIKGITKGIFAAILISFTLLILSFMELMSSIFSEFNLWYFLLATFGIWQFIYLYPWYQNKVKSNKKNEANGLLISSLLGLIILFFNLDYIQNFRRIDLDKLEKRELAFNDLPITVQNVYRTNDYSEYGNFVSTEKENKVSSYSSTMDDGFGTLLKEGFKHHLLINDKHFTLQANQGDPFVLNKGKFYYCKDLNLRFEKVESSQYVEIDITNKMD